MKYLLVCLCFFVMYQCLFALPQPLAEILKQVSRQAGELQNSPEHQFIKSSQPTRSYIVGDTHSFWRWNLSVMPPTWIQTLATCRAVGEHCYVFVANSEWNVHINQANIDTIMVRLEDRTVNDPMQGLIEMDINEFGPIPDELDNDPKLIVFYSALGSFQGTSFDGYFSAYNEVTEAQAQQMNPSGHSNLCEMIYMTCYPLNPVEPVRLSVLAHELAHMIHWGLDPSEATWLDEGCAELAMVKYGVPDPITGFNTNSDLDLTAWTQSFADYVKVMLFFTYLSEHYDTNNLIRDIVADPENGMTSVSNQIISHITDGTIYEIFRDWTIANYIDEPLPDAGLYNYEQLTLPAFNNTFNYTQEFVNVFNVAGTVQPWAADYIRIQQNQWFHQATFTGNHPFYLSTIAVPPAIADSMIISSGEMFDNFEWSNYYWTGANVLVISNPSDNVLSYTFTIVTGDAVDDHVVTPSEAVTVDCYPNPFNAASDFLSINVLDAKSNMKSAKVEIYNMKGQLVATENLQKSNNSQYFTAKWKGEEAASGVYFVRYSDGFKSQSKKFVILR